MGDFAGSSVVKTPSSHCRGHGFDLLVRELRSYMPGSMVPKKTHTKKELLVGNLLSSLTRALSSESTELTIEPAVNSVVDAFLLESQGLSS